MKRIWAPWRIEYIVGEKEKGCIFCNAIRKDELEALVLYKSDLSIVIMNRYPYTNGHIMVAPKRHVGNIEKLFKDEELDIFELIKVSISALKESLYPEGFNIGVNLGKVAGAGVEEHIHFHIVPRWNGDTNFMPVLADIKVMPEYILETYKKIKPKFLEILDRLKI